MRIELPATRALAGMPAGIEGKDWRDVLGRLGIRLGAPGSAGFWARSTLIRAIQYFSDERVKIQSRIAEIDQRLDDLDTAYENAKTEIAKINEKINQLGEITRDIARQNES